MLDEEERRRLEELAVAVIKRPLSEAESVEYGSLLALDLGASREPYERPEPKPRSLAGSQAPKVKRKRRRGRR